MAEAAGSSGTRTADGGTGSAPTPTLEPVTGPVAGPVAGLVSGTPPDRTPDDAPPAGPTPLDQVFSTRPPAAGTTQGHPLPPLASPAGGRPPHQPGSRGDHGHWQHAHRPHGHRPHAHRPAWATGPALLPTKAALAVVAAVALAAVLTTTPRSAWTAAPPAASASRGSAPLAPLAPLVSRAGDLPSRPAAPVPDARSGMAAAATWSGTASYRLTSAGTASSGRADSGARVTLVRRGGSTRVDVATPSGTATLLTTSDGWAACEVPAATGGATASTCVAGAPGVALPAALDPGVGDLVSTELPATARAAGTTVVTGLPATADEAAAGCAHVTTGTAPGTYCVTSAGLLRRAVTVEGRLDLLGSSPDVTEGAFVPPSAPVPLAP